MYQEGGGGGGGGGVKFNDEEEEKCPNPSLLTLARITKAPVESEKGEIREKSRKRKMTETVEVPKESAPTTAHIEESGSEKGGGGGLL